MLVKHAARKLIKAVGDIAAEDLSKAKTRAEARKRLRELRIALTYGKRPVEVAAINMVLDLFQDITDKLDPTYIREWWEETEKQFQEEQEEMARSVDVKELAEQLPDYAAAPIKRLDDVWARVYLTHGDDRLIDAYFVKKGKGKYEVNPRVKQAFAHLLKNFGSNIDKLYMEATGIGHVMGFFQRIKDEPIIALAPTKGVALLQTLYHELVHATAPKYLLELQKHPHTSTLTRSRIRLINEISSEIATRVFNDWVQENYTPEVLVAIKNGVLPVPDTPKWKEFVKRHNIQIEPPAIPRHPIEILAGTEESEPLVEELAGYKGVGPIRRTLYRIWDVLYGPSYYLGGYKVGAVQPNKADPRVAPGGINPPPPGAQSPLQRAPTNQPNNPTLAKWMLVINTMKKILQSLQQNTPGTPQAPSTPNVA